MIRMGMLVAMAAGLAGCQPRVSLLKQEPGNWTATFTLDSFDVANSPPSYRTDLEKALAVRSAAAICLSPEQAKKSDLVSELVNGQGLTDCDFDENSADDNKLVVEAECRDPRDRAVNLSIAGTATPRNADVKITMSGEEQADQPVMVTLHAVLLHNGACTAVAPARAKAAAK